MSNFIIKIWGLLLIIWYSNGNCQLKCFIRGSFVYPDTTMTDAGELTADRFKSVLYSTENETKPNEIKVTCITQV